MILPLQNSGAASLIALSEKLGVEVPEKDNAKFATLDGMVRYLAGRVR